MIIGMPEAAKRLGLSRSDSAKRALESAGVPLVKIDERTYAVEESDLTAFLQQRSGYQGVGRPRKNAAGEDGDEAGDEESDGGQWTGDAPPDAPEAEEGTG